MAVNGPTKLSIEPGAGADDDRAPDAGAHHLGALLDHDPPVELAGLVDRRRRCGARALEQQAVGLQQRRELAGVDPPAGQQLRADPVAVVDQPLDGVGDLQLAAGRRLDGRAPPRGWCGRTGTRRPGPGRSAGRRASRPAARRCRRRRARRRRSGAGRAPRFSRIWADGGVASLARGPARTRSTNAGQVLLEQVVAEVHHEVVVAEELAGDEHAVGQAERRVLGDVGDLQPRTRAPSPTAAITSSRGVADDDADLDDPGLGHGLEAVEQDRLVGHRHQLLGAGVGDRPQAGAGAAGEDQGLHVTLPSRSVGRRARASRRRGQLHCLSAPGTVPIGRAVVGGAAAAGGAAVVGAAVAAASVVAGEAEATEAAPRK